MHISNHHDTIADTIVDGMLLVSNSWAHVLFDTSAPHSFISMSFVTKFGLEFESLESTLCVGVPLGRDCELSLQCSSIHINIDGQ